MGLFTVQTYNLHQHQIQDIWHLENKWKICFHNLKVSKSINNRANTFYKDLLTMS